MPAASAKSGWGKRFSDGEKVAIKTLLPAASAHRELVTRFKREADFLSRIRSQYVAKVVDFMSDKEFGLVLVLEYVDGEALNEILKRTSLSVEETIQVGWDVLGGIADLHREQIIHRDLKPGNIILRKLPSGRQNSVIVDFGMSRLMGLDRDGEEVTALTRADIAVGTLEYMAPEQILNSSGVTGAADIYALGAMLYRAVAGEHIFGDLTDAVLARHKLINDPPPLSTGRSDQLAKGFEAIVMKMVQRGPKERYARAEDVMAHLAQLRSGTFPPELVQPSAPEVAAPPRAEPARSASSSNLAATLPDDSHPSAADASNPSLPPVSPSNPSNPSNPSLPPVSPSNQSHASLPPVSPSNPSHPSLPPATSLRSTSLDASLAPPPPRRGFALALTIGLLIGGGLVAALFVWKRQWIFVAPSPDPTEESSPVTGGPPPVDLTALATAPAPSASAEPAVKAEKTDAAPSPSANVGPRDR